MNAHVETDLAAIPKDQWNDLLALAVTGTVFQTYEWHAAWWRTYGADKRAFIICVMEDGCLLGLAPLMLEGECGKPRTLSFIGTGRSDYLDFIYPPDKPDVLEAIVSFLRDHGSDWDTINLVRVPDHSETARSLRAACSNNRLYCHVADKIASPTLRLVYDPAGNAINLTDQKKVSRHQSYFRRQDGYRVQHLTDGSAISGYLDAFFDQHVARWSGTDTPSLFVEENNRAFYRELVSTMGPTGWMVLTVMEALGKPFASLLSFVYGNRLLGYKQSFDVSLAKRSPGDALVREVRDYAVARRLGEFDFSVGAEPYKLRFANHVRYNLSYRIHRTMGRFLIGRGWTALKCQARRTPVGRSLARRAARFREFYIPLARDVIKKRGPVRFVWGVARRVWKKLIFEYVHLLFLETPHGQIVEESNRVALAGVSFKEARIEDLRRFPYSDYEAVTQEFIRQSQRRYQLGNRCFMAEYAGRPVCIAWFREETKTYMKEVRTWVPIGPNAVTFCDQVTAPAFRSKGLAGFVLARALNALKDKKKVGYLSPANEPSKRNLLRHGFRVTQSYHMIRILGIPIRWHTDVPPVDAENHNA